MDYAYKAHHFWVRPGDPRAALRVLPAALLRDVPGRPRRRAGSRAARPRRQLDVGQRLPPPRGVVAALRRVDRASDGWPRPTSRGRRSSAPTQSASSPCSARPVVHGAAVVVGVGESRYYKRGEATESEFQLACIAIRNAVDDAGLTMRDVDGVVSYMERNEPVRLSAALGHGRPRVHGADVRRRRQRRRRRGHPRGRGDHRGLRTVRRRLPVAGAGPVRTLRPVGSAPVGRTARARSRCRMASRRPRRSARCRRSGSCTTTASRRTAWPRSCSPATRTRSATRGRSGSARR